MNAERRSGTPISCQLSSSGQAERAAHLREALFSRVLSTTELEDGFAYQFPGEDAVLQQLTAFVLFERHCCPFFTFELRFEPHGGPATLLLCGPEGTKAFLEAWERPDTG